MSRSIVICEKPSQAKALKKAVGTKYGEIYPARGHLLRLKEPGEAVPEFERWTAGMVWPGTFYDKMPLPETRSMLDRIASAARNATKIIIATDCDREGQLIGNEIVDFIGFKGNVQRAIFNAEDPASLRDAFNALHDNADFKGLYDAGQAREQADQVSNLSLTRTATVSLRAPGYSGVIGIGRVKTPVLGILCKRESEIRNFKPEDLQEIDATVAARNGNLVLTCRQIPDTMVAAAAETEAPDDTTEDDEDTDSALVMRSDNPKAIRDADLAERLRAHVTGHSGKLDAKARKARRAPPKLFDLTSLQSAASARFGWSGEQTLTVAQSLYANHTLITYPRAEARHLPERNIEDIPRLLPALLALPDYHAYEEILAQPQARRGKSGHFSDKALEGMSHYAIIPNVNVASQVAAKVEQLDCDETSLFDMICRQYLAALAPDYEFRQTTVSMTVPMEGHDWLFRTIGNVPLALGWRHILGGDQKADQKEQDLPELTDGETGKISSAERRVVTTRPPARYSEGSLIKVMLEAWRLVDDAKMREKLKSSRGIGTPSTRADILKTLIRQGQVETRGKTLRPTEAGMMLYEKLCEVCPNVVDPGRTAVWESIFELVEKRRMSAEDAVNRIIKATEQEVQTISGQSVDHGNEGIAIGKQRTPTRNMTNLARQIATDRNLDLPKGYDKDARLCRHFLDQHVGKSEGATTTNGSNGRRGPTEKQLAFADSLAAQLNEPVPEDARSDARQLSEWIDKAKARAPASEPTPKQIALAQKIADEKGIDLPESVTANRQACSRWLDTQMKSGKTGDNRQRKSKKRGAGGNILS